jgi:SnoaL-like domain
MATPTDLSALARQVEQLANEVGLLNDAQAIRKLQHAYGYYLDKCLYDEVVDLFADDGEVRFMGGAFKGKAGLRRLYCERFRKNFRGPLPLRASCHWKEVAASLTTTACGRKNVAIRGERSQVSSE